MRDGRWEVEGAVRSARDAGREALWAESCGEREREG